MWVWVWVWVWVFEVVMDAGWFGDDDEEVVVEDVRKPARIRVVASSKVRVDKEEVDEEDDEEERVIVDDVGVAWSADRYFSNDNA